MDGGAPAASLPRAATLGGFDITAPMTLDNKAALAVNVLERFHGGEGPFTQPDALKVAGIINQLRGQPEQPAQQAGRMPGTIGSPNLGSHQFHTMFCIGQRVIIDDDHSAHATITEILIKAGGVIYRAAWVQNGESKEPWLDEFRLSVALTDR